jgi:hypothetical protein
MIPRFQDSKIADSMSYMSRLTKPLRLIVELNLTIQSHKLPSCWEIVEKLSILYTTCYYTDRYSYYFDYIAYIDYNNYIAQCT